MDWDFFKEGTRYRLKRLPPPKGTVKIKDCTDISGFRECFESTECVDSFADTYLHYFDFPEQYEVEVESFESYFSRNPNKFLGALSRLKDNYDLIYDLRNWFEYPPEYGWMFLEDSALCKQLLMGEIVEIKEKITDQDWIEYLRQKYNLDEFKALGKKYDIPLKGNKLLQASTLTKAIQSKLIPHKPPILIKPGNALDLWFGTIQLKYVVEIINALPISIYPVQFIIAVLDCAYDENYEHLEIGFAIAKVLDGISPEKASTMRDRLLNAGPNSGTV